MRSTNMPAMWWTMVASQNQNYLMDGHQDGSLRNRNFLHHHSIRYHPRRRAILDQCRWLGRFSNPQTHKDSPRTWHQFQVRIDDGLDPPFSDTRITVLDQWLEIVATLPRRLPLQVLVALGPFTVQRYSNLLSRSYHQITFLKLRKILFKKYNFCITI